MTTKQQKAKFVEAKLLGASDTKAAMIAKPELRPSSAPNTGMRLSRDVDVQAALQKALEKHDITIDRIAKRISEGMDAEKQNNFTGEVTPDQTARLKATDMAMGLTGLKAKTEPPKPDKINPGTAKELAEAIRNGDEVQVTQAVWGKKK